MSKVYLIYYTSMQYREVVLGVFASREAAEETLKLSSPDIRNNSSIGNQTLYKEGILL